MTSKPMDLDGACKVCGRVLDWEADRWGENGRWVHTFQDRKNEDHAPVWAPEKDVPTVYRCDFCNEDGPTFSLPVHDFTQPSDTHAVSLGEWLCCAQCVVLIQADDWEALVTRALTISPSLAAGLASGEYIESDVRQFLRDMYARVRENRLGEPVPWSPDA